MRLGATPQNGQWYAVMPMLLWNLLQIETYWYRMVLQLETCRVFHCDMEKPWVMHHDDVITHMAKILKIHLNQILYIITYI